MTTGATEMRELPDVAEIAHLPEVDAFLDGGPKGLYVDGRWLPAGGRSIDAVDPASGRLLARIGEATADDVDRAIDAARRAFDDGPWPRLQPDERSRVLERLADLLDERAQFLGQVESLDEGKPLGDTAGYDIPQFTGALRYYAALARSTDLRQPLHASGVDAYEHRQPYGVCAFVVPWNAPLLLLGWGLAPALAAGNTVVIKPASDASLSLLALAQLCTEAGLPPGVVNVVTGTGQVTGTALAANPRIQRMAFTGSPEAGRLVSELCGRNLVPVKLELGGKGAAVIFDDVDVQGTAAALAGVLSLNAGQVCCTPTRWIVHEDVANAFTEAAGAALAGLRIGHGLAPATQMGPLINERQRARVLAYLEKGVRQGARELLAGGIARPDGYENGFFVRPAMLAGGPENICACDEIFGPVAYVMTFRTEAEAIALANGTPYGLANAVWTADQDRASRVAEAMSAGTSWINSALVFAPGVRYGGWHMSGMGGGVLAPDALLDYLRKKVVVRVA